MNHVKPIRLVLFHHNQSHSEFMIKLYTYLHLSFFMYLFICLKFNYIQLPWFTDNEII